MSYVLELADSGVGFLVAAILGFGLWNLVTRGVQLLVIV